MKTEGSAATLAVLSFVLNFLTLGVRTRENMEMVVSVSWFLKLCFYALAQKYISIISEETFLK